MKGRLHAGKENSASPLWWEERALYLNTLGDDRTARVLDAQEFVDITSARGWRELLAEVYPEGRLTEEDWHSLPNANIGLRAILLLRALDAALRVIGAPDNVRSDLDFLLKAFVPVGATRRAGAQKEALKRRGRSKNAIATAAKYDPSMFNREVNSGEIAILDYPDEPGEWAYSGTK